MVQLVYCLGLLFLLMGCVEVSVTPEEPGEGTTETGEGTETTETGEGTEKTETGEGTETTETGEGTETEEDTETTESSEIPNAPNLSEGDMEPSGGDLKSSLTVQTVEYTMYDFLEYVVQDLDAYWTYVLTYNGYPEPQVNYAFPSPGEPVETLCSKTGYTSEEDASYCGLDDMIVVTQKMATDIWMGQVKGEKNLDPEIGYSSGDFSVALIVAHEFAHSIQAELGWLPTTLEEAESGRLVPVINTELNADCLAGVWANDVYYRNLLEAGDIEEAIRTTNDIGDYGFENPKHHGTPAQRVEAFLAGYNNGNPSSCDNYLLNEITVGQ